jgi:hypothetical protein
VGKDSAGKEGKKKKSQCQQDDSAFWCLPDGCAIADDCCIFGSRSAFVIVGELVGDNLAAFGTARLL